MTGSRNGPQSITPSFVVERHQGRALRNGCFAGLLVGIDMRNIAAQRSCWHPRSMILSFATKP
jgi:hypothetical protein